MKSIKVGFLPLYIKLYDDASGPGYRAPMERYMDQCVRMLESQGVEVVMADQVCRIKPEFDAAAEKFNAADVDAVVTMHLAYSPSLESIEALLRLKAPIIVFDTTPDYELIRSMGSENRIGPNHGIHGVQDMCNLLRRSGKPYYICAGHAMHSDVITELAGLCRAAAVRKAFQSMRIGSVGGSFTGMGDFQISDERFKADIGASVLYMTPSVVKKHLAEVTEREIDEEIARNAQQCDVQIDDIENYRLAVKSGLAVRKWMEAERLGAATVNFLTLDVCGLPKMPFPECCKILGRGQGYAGEGDVLTAGLVGALFAAYPNTTFTEMFCPDWEQDIILLSHMGESNPNLARWKPHIRSIPFRYNTCGDTVGMYGCYRGGDVTIVNLAPMNDTFNLILCPGKLLDIGLENGAYGNSTQGWYKPNLPLPEFLKAYSMAGGTHHSAMVYDADIRELEAFGDMMGFDVVTIG